MKNYVVVKSMTKKNQWELTSFTLSHPLHEDSVVFIRNENFVFVIDGMKQDKQISGKLIVFTEKNGYSEVDQFSFKISRYGYVSVLFWK